MSREQKNTRASYDEIFTHLKTLLGDEAAQVSQNIARLEISGNREAALAQLKAYDETLDGIGVAYVMQHKQKPPVVLTKKRRFVSSFMGAVQFEHIVGCAEAIHRVK